MISVKRRSTNRGRRGAPWTEEDDERLLAVAHLPPRAIADLMRRSWLACRRRLAYLRADGAITDSRDRRSSSARR